MFHKISELVQPKRNNDATVSAVVGTVVGMAVGSAATMYLSKSENRKKVTDAVSQLKTGAQKMVATSETKLDKS